METTNTFLFLHDKLIETLLQNTNRPNSCTDKSCKYLSSTLKTFYPFPTHKYQFIKAIDNETFEEIQ